MLDQITADIKSAMKNKEKEKLEAIRYLKSMLIENKTSKKPQPELDVVIGLHKKLTDSISMYPPESEQALKLKNEIGFLAAYMPKQLSEDEVIEIIKNLISKGATNVGAVMKDLSPQIKGKFNGKRASELVKENLG